MKKLLVTIPFTLLLTGCGVPSVEDMIEDPNKLGKALEECNTLMLQGKDIDTELCQNAAEAQSQMVGNMMNGMMKQFGLKK